LTEATAFAEEASARLSRLGAGDGNIALLYTVDGDWGGNTCMGKTATLVIDLTYANKESGTNAARKCH